LLIRWFFQHSSAGKTIVNAKKTIAGGKSYSLDGFFSISVLEKPSGEQISALES
jgi:hypothetical protein